MAIPISYNVRSIAARWKTAIVSILGIAGTVGVFVAMLAMARGFQATLIASGSASNSIVRRAGSSSEMDSGVSLDQARVIADAAQVARNGEGVPLSSPEMVVIGAFQLIKSGTDANTQIRGMKLPKDGSLPKVLQNWSSAPTRSKPTVDWSSVRP